MYLGARIDLVAGITNIFSVHTDGNTRRCSGTIVLTCNDNVVAPGGLRISNTRRFREAGLRCVPDDLSTFHGGRIFLSKNKGATVRRTGRLLSVTGNIALTCHDGRLHTRRRDMRDFYGGNNALLLRARVHSFRSGHRNRVRTISLSINNRRQAMISGTIVIGRNFTDGRTVAFKSMIRLAFGRGGFVRNDPSDAVNRPNVFTTNSTVTCANGIGLLINAFRSTIGTIGDIGRCLGPATRGRTVISSRGRTFIRGGGRFDLWVYEFMSL